MFLCYSSIIRVDKQCNQIKRKREVWFGGNFLAVKDVLKLVKVLLHVLLCARYADLPHFFEKFADSPGHG